MPFQCDFSGTTGPNDFKEKWLESSGHWITPHVKWGVTKIRKGCEKGSWGRSILTMSNNGSTPTPARATTAIHDDTLESDLSKFHFIWSVSKRIFLNTYNTMLWLNSKCWRRMGVMTWSSVSGRNVSYILKLRTMPVLRSEWNIWLVGWGKDWILPSNQLTSYFIQISAWTCFCLPTWKGSWDI